MLILCMRSVDSEVLYKLVSKDLQSGRFVEVTTLSKVPEALSMILFIIFISQFYRIISLYFGSDGSIKHPAFQSNAT